MGNMVHSRSVSAAAPGLLLPALLLPGLLLLGPLVGTATVAAQPGEPASGEARALRKARALFKRAEVSYSLGEFDRALTLYKEAYRSRQLPEFLFNIGQCYRHQGRCKEAVFHFRQFLLRQPRAPEKHQVRRLIRECQAALAEERRKEEDRSRMQRDAAAAARARGSGWLFGPGAPGRRPWRVAFWGGVGVTTALLGTAVVTAVLSRKKADEYMDYGIAARKRQDLRQDARVLDIASWTAFGLGAAALGGTVALYFLGRGPVQDARATAPKSGGVTLSPVRGGGMVLLRGGF